MAEDDVEAAIEALMQLVARADVAPGVYMVVKPEGGSPFGSSNRAGTYTHADHSETVTFQDTLTMAKGVLEALRFGGSPP